VPPVGKHSLGEARRFDVPSHSWPTQRRGRGAQRAQQRKARAALASGSPSSATRATRLPPPGNFTSAGRCLHEGTCSPGPPVCRHVLPALEQHDAVSMSIVQTTCPASHAVHLTENSQKIGAGWLFTRHGGSHRACGPQLHPMPTRGHSHAGRHTSRSWSVVPW
jgi:hypothetical protein